MDIVRFLLPYPQKLLDGGFEVRPPDRDYREFLLKIVAVDKPEQLYRVCGRAVVPFRAHVEIGIPGAVFEDIRNIFLEYFVCNAHSSFSLPKINLFIMNTAARIEFIVASTMPMILSAMPADAL